MSRGLKHIYQRKIDFTHKKREISKEKLHLRANLTNVVKQFLQGLAAAAVAAAAVVAATAAVIVTAATTAAKLIVTLL